MAPHDDGGDGTLLTRARTAALLAVLVTALAVLSASPATAGHRSRSRLEQTRREIRATRTMLQKTQRAENVVTAALNKYTRLLNHNQAQLASARALLQSIGFRIGMAERRLRALARQRAVRSLTIARRARALYIMGPMDGLAAVTQAKTLDEFVGRASALEFIAAFDRTALEDLARISHETRETRLSLDKEKARGRELEDEVEDRVAAVAEVVQAKQEVKADLDQDIEAYRDMLAALQAEQSRIQAIIASRSGGYQGSIGTGEAGRLGFRWPTLGRHITSPYGSRWGGFHTGMDIDCRTGDPIAASKDGRVIAAEYAGGYGKMVIIDHGGGYTTLYAHMSRLYVGDGGDVDTGRVIGACGATGRATGDHLHFEVRRGGQHTNPRPYLS